MENSTIYFIILIFLIIIVIIISVVLHNRRNITLRALLLPLSTTSGTATQVTGKRYIANLNGSKVVPTVNTKALGAASIILDTSNRLTYNISAIFPNSTVQFANIHRGTAGTNGPLVTTLGIVQPVGVFNPTLATYIGTTRVLTTTEINDLNADRLYINIPSTTHSNGEIRGQINIL